MKSRHSFRPVIRSGDHEGGVRVVAEVDKAPVEYLPKMMIVLALVVAGAVAGCGGGSASGNGDDAPSASNAPPVAPAPYEPWLGGQYFGTATAEDGEHPVEGLLLPTGELRMTIGAPWEPAGSAQFIGWVQKDGEQADGTGIVIGQGCGSSRPSRFCGMRVPAAVSLTEPASSLEPIEQIPVTGIKTFYYETPVLSGDLTVTIDDATENWSLELSGRRNYFDLDHPLADLANVYSDFYYDNAERAVFGNDVTINVDALGQVFFQSAATGCIGNGSMIPYGNGKSDVFNVTLLVEACTGVRAHLNGAFDGLARNLGGDDAFGKVVVLYISRTAEEAVPVAATFWWLTYL